MYSVVVRYVAQPGRGDEVAAALRPHTTATRAEPGCVAFAANRSVDDPDVFVLYECYRDEDAFQEHTRTPHFQTYIVEGVRTLITTREASTYVPVEP